MRHRILLSIKQNNTQFMVNEKLTNVKSMHSQFKESIKKYEENKKNYQLFTLTFLSVFILTFIIVIKKENRLHKAKHDFFNCLTLVYMGYPQFHFLKQHIH